ncbi:HCLS1-binding protein 3 [Myotis lucifugus]|uniref:HCLS1-binding protein 3 n=1 Tax=Myotis lucifugus TaxID=59463 RepID=UPI000CCC5F4E|nr:HCLS1-binding protein 3 [Myotis lucifugus]
MEWVMSVNAMCQDPKPREAQDPLSKSGCESLLGLLCKIQRGCRSRLHWQKSSPWCHISHRLAEPLIPFLRVQNVHTGLDLAVPQHQEVRGKMMSGHVEYQILVVTRLAAFKSAKHKPEDVVQFLVTYALHEYFSTLCSRFLYSCSPAFPAVPRPTPTPPHPTPPSAHPDRSRPVFAAAATRGSKKPKKCPKVAAKPRPSPRLTLFDEEVDPDAGLFSPSRKLSAGGSAEDAPPRDPLKLFDDPDLGGAVPLGDPLLLPAAPASGGPAPRLGYGEAAEELFRVEEDLDQILNLGAETKPQPPPKPKPPVAAKPAPPRKPAAPPRAGPSEAAAGPPPPPPQQIQAMDEMDILQYIRDHDAPGQAAPSLF